MAAEREGPTVDLAEGAWVTAGMEVVEPATERGARGTKSEESDT